MALHVDWWRSPARPAGHVAHGADLAGGSECRRAQIRHPADEWLHYDNAILIERGLLSRKSAPETFNVGGFRHMLDRLVRNDEDQIAIPVFDRELDISRAGAHLVPRDVRVLIADGNYLLLNGPPWADLGSFFDTSVRVTADASVLRRRLAQRWIDAKLEPVEIAREVDGNDLLDGRPVLTQSRSVDFIVDTSWSVPQVHRRSSMLRR